MMNCTRYTGLPLLLTCAVFAISETNAAAENIKYENPGLTYDFNYQWLDVTKPAQMQAGDEVASSVRPYAQVRDIDFGLMAYVSMGGATGTQGIERIELESSALLNPNGIRVGSGYIFGPDTVDQLNDDGVPPKYNYEDYSWSSAGVGHSAWTYGIGEVEDLQLNLPASRASMPFRFTLPDGVHYGWVEYEADGNQNAFGHHELPPNEDIFAKITVYAWGWQTVPNEPVTVGQGIPAPGAALLLGLTGVTVLRRRR